MRLSLAAARRWRPGRRLLQGDRDIRADADGAVEVQRPAHRFRQPFGQDEPEPVGAGGLRDWYPEYSYFCSRVHAPEAFRTVMRRLDVPWVFLSYSEDGVVPPDTLFELLDEFGDVTRDEMSLQRYRSNQGGKGGTVSEHLYAVKMR